MESTPASRSRRTCLPDAGSLQTEPEITPTKRRQPLDELLDRLNTQWNLDLPRLHGLEADRLEATTALAKRCSARLRYLSYRPLDLEEILTDFDQQASVIFSQWKFKPHAERHVTPSRKANESNLARSILKGKQPALTKVQKQRLLTCLDNVLERPYKLCRDSDSFQTSNSPINDLRSPSARATPSSTRNSSTMRSTARVTKPVAGGYSSETKPPVKPQGAPKRQSDATDGREASQKKTKTLHDWFAKKQTATTARSDPQASMPQTPSRDPPCETIAAMSASDETMLKDDDIEDLFPPTQEDAGIFEHPDVLRSMDSGYVSGSPRTLTSRLSSTFNTSMLDMPTFGLAYDFVWELQSVSLSLNVPSREILRQVRSICRTDNPTIEERLAAYRKIADNRPYEPFGRLSWLPSAGLPDDKQLHRSLYQEASLSFSQSRDPDASPFDLRLHAPRSQQSCRFHRIFGGHRFLTINVPNWREGFVSGLSDAEDYHEAISNWLCDGIKIGYRFWRPYWVEDKAKQDQNDQWYYQVHLFATTGLELDDNPMSIKDFLDLHTPLKANMKSTDHKLFARGKLGLSKTTPTVVLHKDEFLQVDDIHSEVGTVMTDGCALMSIGLGIAIAQSLGLDQVPSAYQGRISGAKGVWLVDKRNTFAHELHGRNFWIQITPSQLKIQPHPRERDCVDAIRTFEVSDYSKTLRPSSLNIQLLNVLYNRGVDPRVLSKRLQSFTAEYFDELCGSIERDDPLLTHAWLQKYHSGNQQRADFQFVGGRPIAKIDQIKTYLDVGFSVREHRGLHDLVSETLRGYLDEYVEKIRIDLPRSTNAFMVPDVWGILEEGEVQVCLGQAWTDPETGLECTFVADVEGLVARNPANHPADVQRVKFAHYPQLASYSNVIFFSTKGKRPLADYLSGGDYDGDQAFICWDPEIVEGFRNFASGPPDHIKIEDVGLVRCSFQLDMVFKEGINEGTIKDYLRGCVAFALQPSSVGTVTNVHAAFVYRQSKRLGLMGGREALESNGAVTLAALAAYLVDALKQGYRLPPNSWLALKRQVCGPFELPKPAYQEPEKDIPDNFESDNIIDHLRFKVARRQKQALLNRWWELTRSWPLGPDSALLQAFRAWDKKVDEERSGKSDKVYQQIFLRLKEDLDIILHLWKLSARPKPGRDAAGTIKAIGEVYDSYQQVKPLQVAGKESHEFYRTLDLAQQMGVDLWAQVRASYLYKRFQYSSPKFVWSMAGLDLCQMKAKTLGRTIPVQARTYGTMKLNTKAVKAVSEMTDVQEEEEVRELVDEEDETQWFDAQASFDLEEVPRQYY